MTRHEKLHHMTWHLATNHNTSPHVPSQPTTLLHLSSQPATWHHIPHHSTLHHHHRHTTETQPATTKTPPPNGTAAGWCTQKPRFGHRIGWLLCAHSIGKFHNLAYSFFPPETSAPACPALFVSVWIKQKHESNPPFLPNINLKPISSHGRAFIHAVLSFDTTPTACSSLHNHISISVFGTTWNINNKE